MKKKNSQLLLKLPSIDMLLRDVAFEDYTTSIPRRVVVDSIRQSVDKARKFLISQGPSEVTKGEIREKIIVDAKNRIEAIMKPFYRKVVNATGIVLHTGLGRAVLPESALEQIHQELSGYSLLQLDIETGGRSRRDECIERLLQILTGAEAATIVNNNAAATFIVLNTIAKGKDVIVSRGQLVEIGGSFRLPEVMALSGARLVEVGTTNRTHLRDYENAVTENTAAILRVHPSNYKIEGFTSEVALEELVALAKARGLVMIDDVGAGALIDFSKFGFESDPVLGDSISKGADLVTSSADKLIGASQGGLILGKAELVEAIRKSSFSRVLRVGKLTLAAIEATLKLFLDESAALNRVPTLQMIVKDISVITNEAKRIAVRLHKNIPDATVTTETGFSQAGSGSLPAQNIATTLVVIKPKTTSAEQLAKRLRSYRIPVFTRIQNEQILIDPRTLRQGDDRIIVEAFTEILTVKD